MSKTRTEYRKERRILLKEVFDKLFIIQSFNDTDLEKIRRQFFINLNLDLDSIINRVTLGERYVHEPYIYANDNDDVAETGDKN